MAPLRSLVHPVTPRLAGEADASEKRIDSGRCRLQSLNNARALGTCDEALQPERGQDSRIAGDEREQSQQQRTEAKDPETSAEIERESVPIVIVQEVELDVEEH